jgi:hypothetical protein
MKNKFIKKELVYLRRYLYRSISLNTLILILFFTSYTTYFYGGNFAFTLMWNIIILYPIVYIFFLRGREKKDLLKK